MGRIIEIWASENLEMQLDELENDSTIDDLADEMLKKGYMSQLVSDIYNSEKAAIQAYNNKQQ